MRLPRALIVTLALMVSPVSAAVCEVVCGVSMMTVSADATTVAAASDEHAHHGHHAPPAPVVPVAQKSVDATDVGSVSIPAPECDLRVGAPARLRTAFTDSTVAAATLPTTAPWGDSLRRSQPAVAAASSPPSPSPHAPVPLRI